MLKEELIMNLNGCCNPENEHICKNTRITVLTDNLIRVEYDKTQTFCDFPTQKIISRYTNTVNFTVEQIGEKIIVKTEKVIFVIRRGKFVSASLDFGKSFVKERKSQNLLGTARTLDVAFSAIKLQKGLLSKNCVTTLDDSKSLLFDDDGKLVERQIHERDFYVFAATKYQTVMSDFFKISGKPPMLPRYAFGNFWSRYHAYSEEEYLELMKKFQEKDIPLAVSVIDMDWHYVDVKKAFPKLYENKSAPSGWTGYTFDKSLFPDSKRFLNELHKMGLKTTLNLHPADGIYPHEEAFPLFKKAMNLEKDVDHIPFDITDENFINAYFEILHKPLEEDGVDFWWIDWQQGKKSKIKNLDPLFSLNHYHYLYSAKNNHRGIILSRFSGIGAHRYPIGFSGDTFMNFPLLKFIPKFTATASNVGYQTWSHDIGGHMFGKTSEQLYLRWLELGAFLPINRLHSTSLDAMGKEPWKRRHDTEIFATKYLRLRHELVPYLYNAHKKSAFSDGALTSPLYYKFQSDPNAYKFSHEYFLGDELLVCPIAKSVNAKTQMADAHAYLPKGDYIDIFTRKKYCDYLGYVCRQAENFPVFLKKGAILPLAHDYRKTSNPRILELLTYCGDGEFELYEDEGENLNYLLGEWVTTKFSSKKKSDSYDFEISPSEGELSLIPCQRTYLLKPLDIKTAQKCEVTIGGETKEYQKHELSGRTIFTANQKAFDNIRGEDLIYSDVVVILTDVSIKSNAKISLFGVNELSNGTIKDNLVDFFSLLNGNNMHKNAIYSKLKKAAADKQSLLREAKKMCLPKAVKRALFEIIEISEY